MKGSRSPLVRTGAGMNHRIVPFHPSGGFPTLLLSVVVAAGCVAGRDLPVPPEAGEGISRELADLRKRTIVDPHFDLFLSIPEGRELPVEGRVRIRFSWSGRGSDPLILDFREPERGIVSLSVNGTPEEPRFSANHLWIPGDRFSPDEEQEIEVRFRAGDGSLNRSADYLYTLFVPDRAHTAIPLFDQPNLKGRWRVSLEVPEDWEALANGVPEGEEVVSPGRRLLRFAETPPLPSYLVAFVAGRFQVERAERAGRTLTFLHRETDPEKVRNNLPAILDLHGTALEWLEEYTGMAYPFDSFGFAAIPAFQYGGMEHPGAVLYRASSLFLEESRTQAEELGRASLIAHETAHMWFGDLVTMDWFDDVWTKEVFANFMAAKIVHPSFPQIDHDLRFLLAHHPAAYAIDRTAGANPIRQPLENLREAGTLYGPIIYQKAPVVMRQLERTLGPERFREGIREYLQAFAYENATWPDLITILDRIAPEQGLPEWSRVWVEEAGRPEVRVERSGVRVLEGVRLLPRDPQDAGRVWPQEVEVILGFGGGARIQRYPVRISDVPVDVPIPQGFPVPDFILPNGGGVEYGLFRLDPGTRGWLLEGLPGIPDPLLRGTAWITLWDAVLEGEVGVVEFLELLERGIVEEQDPLNLDRILGMTTTTVDLLLDPDLRRSRGAGTEDVLLERLRISAEEGDAAAAAALFRSWRSIVRTSAGTARLARIARGEEEVPGVVLGEEDRIALAGALALRQVEGWERLWDERVSRTSNPDRRERMEFVRPALDRDPGVRAAFFESLSRPERRAREPWVLEALGYLHHPLREGDGERFIRPALELLPEIQRTGDIFFPAGWVGAALERHATPGAVSVVREFLDATPGLPPRLRGKVLQSADLPARAARLRAGQRQGSSVASQPSM